MKLTFTPLILTSVALLLYAIYYIIGMFLYEKGGNLGGLVVLFCLFTAAIILFLSFGFRRLFKTKIWGQVVTELVLILIIGFLYYKKSGSLILHVPKNYSGYLVIVYGAEKKPKLTTGFLNNNIDIIVPSSGIVLTSSGREKGISVVDGTNKERKLIKVGEGIPYTWDTLYCGSKNYDLDLVIFDKLPTESAYNEDTLILHMKKMQACKMLSE